MKSVTILFSAYLMLALPVAFSQVVVSDPLFPTATDQVTITFDATKGSGNLAGYTGDVYAHTGVKIQGNNAWQYVIGSWGNNTTQPKLTRIGPNLYQLVISPSIRQFYNVPADKVITQMAFVFRAASGSPQTEDLFLDVYPPGLNIMINSPANHGIYTLGQEIAVNAVANLADSMFLILNADTLSRVAGNQLVFNYITTSYGKQKFYLVAKNTQQTKTDSIFFFVRTDVPVAELPQGVRSGINYLSDTSVTLVLHDPPALKQFVFLIGSFNDFQVDENYFMNRTPDGKYYWLTLDNLEPGVEYIYQYYIDGQLRLADPYCEKVSDPWNDHYIPSSTYPGLISYPTGKTTGIASVFQTAQVPYNWEVTNFAPPAPHDLIIYELHIRDFVATRDIKTVTDTLDYLQRLGVNAIELMPINEFEGNDSWGYNPSFYFATDKAYGRKQDYQRFIDECHKRGMAVIIDMVLNHSFGQSPLVQMYFNPNAGQWGQPSPDNPWYNQTCPHQPWCWGYDFNHLSAHTQEFIDRVNTFWLTEFKVDGFRFDFTKGFTNYQTGNQGWDYDVIRINILKRMASKIWEVNPQAYVILEHFTANQEEKVLAEYGMLIWGNMHSAYRDAIRASNPSSNFSNISYKQRQWNVPHLVGYMESHDEQRQMYENLTSGNTSNPAHNIRTLSTALKRMELGNLFFLTIPGPKMIWQFGEIGYDYSIDYGCRLCPKPVRWDYLDDYRRRYLYNFIASLLNLRRSHEVFRTTDFTLSLGNPAKFIKLNHLQMNVVIVGNFAVTASNVTPGFQHTGWWYDYFKGDSIQVTNLNQVISLQAGEYRLYTNKKLTKPSIGTGIDSRPETMGQSLRLITEHDTGKQWVRIDVGDKADLTLSLTDLAGRTVKTLYSGRMLPGIHDILLPSGLPSGFYLITLLNGNMATAVKCVIP